MAPRPAHSKCTIDGKTLYACVLHAAELERRHPVYANCPIEPVPSHERDQAGVWCSFCNKERT